MIFAFLLALVVPPALAATASAPMEKAASPPAAAQTTKAAASATPAAAASKSVQAAQSSAPPAPAAPKPVQATQTASATPAPAVATRAPASAPSETVPKPANEMVAGNLGEPAMDSALESYLSLRDPFRRPQQAIEKLGPKTDLESYPADAFKYIGILTGPKKLRAMLVDPSGKTHFVSEKMKIGMRGGVIMSITPDTIKVREKVMNLVGQAENVDLELRLPSAEGQKSVE